MILVDSGASAHLVGDELIPVPQHSMRDHKKLKEPKPLVAAGNKVFAIITGTI